MTATGRAFELYHTAVGDGAVSADKHSRIVEFLIPYIRSVVRARTRLPTGSNRDDAESEACLVVFQAIINLQLPVSDHDKFRAAVRKLVICNLARLAQRENARRLAEGIYVQCGNVSQPLLHEAVATAELVKGAERLLVQAMLGRSRFSAVTPDLCKEVIDWHNREHRSRGLLGSRLRDSGFWDRWFLSRYLETLYRWARYDLREGLLAS